MSSSPDSESRTPPTDALGTFTALTEAILEVVSTWSEDDLSGFLAGERDLVLRPRRKRPRTSPQRKPGRSSSVDADVVRSDLSRLDTREAGIEYLDRLDLTRESLRRLATELDLPATRADTVERLRDRIVEGLIGYRLRSSAVRGGDVRRLPPVVGSLGETSTRTLDPPME